MNGKKRQCKRVFLAASLLLIGLFVLQGCKKSEPAAPSGTEAEQVASATIEQTTCPIMGNAINKAIFTEYKGKKVYFCCPGCEEKFNEEPEKYIAKLPQFKQ